uniref:Uncharacterized protein n=1 Tax=viral metagenome TaxID=1070528 RepID=A0A6H2A2K9_9ZZZZ
MKIYDTDGNLIEDTQSYNSKVIYFLDGDIDGGDLNGCTEAMDDLDIDLDGGTL